MGKLQIDKGAYYFSLLPGVKGQVGDRPESVVLAVLWLTRKLNLYNSQHIKAAVPDLFCTMEQFDIRHVSTDKEEVSHT